jgi:hypothetical protein
MLNNNEHNNILEKIAQEEKCGNGKGKNKHYYTKWYDFYFNCIRHKKINILEIGVDQGYSLFMWKRYFDNSIIYGMDKYSHTLPNNIKKEFKIFIGDQSNEQFLKDVCNSVPLGFDIIIDDASHIPNLQVSSFNFLFKKLNKGGVYVVEDLYSSYYPKFKKNKISSFIDFCKERVDDVNFHGRFKWCNFDIIKKNVFTDIRKKGKRDLMPRELNIYEEMIESIHFYNGICFIFKN